MDGTLTFLIQRNSCHKILLLKGTAVAFKNILCSICWFLYELGRMINGCDATQ